MGLLGVSKHNCIHSVYVETTKQVTGVPTRTKQTVFDRFVSLHFASLRSVLPHYSTPGLIVLFVSCWIYGKYMDYCYGFLTPKTGHFACECYVVVMLCYVMSRRAHQLLFFISGFRSTIDVSLAHHCGWCVSGLM